MMESFLAGQSDFTMFVAKTNKAADKQKAASKKCSIETTKRSEQLIRIHVQYRE